METTTIPESKPEEQVAGGEQSEPKALPLMIPAELLPNLKKNAGLIIDGARKEGKITTRGITAMIRPEAISDRYRLQSTVALLDGFLATIGITLARGGTDLEMRKMPLPQLVARVTVSINFRSLKEEDIKFLSSVENQKTEFDNSDLALYRKIVQRFPLLKHEQTMELFKKRETGDIEAQYLLILHNLKLVFSWAHKYEDRGLDLPDLVQEGIIGLMTAVNKFDWRRGFHLSTYASWWIRQHMARAIQDKVRSIRIPTHFIEKYEMIRRASKALVFELGRDPTDDEIAAKLKLSGKFVSMILSGVQETQTHSLGDPIGSDEDSSLLQDTLCDTQAVSPSSALEAKEMLDEVAGEVREFLIRFSTLPSLDERWRHIFRMRYGLGGTFFARSTLEEVGEKFDVSRTRIGQIVGACWERLKQDGRQENERWLTQKLQQIEELESVTGVLTKV